MFDDFIRISKLWFYDSRCFHYFVQPQYIHSYIHSRRTKLYLSSVPSTGRVWHKLFLRWARAQGRSPHAPDIFKNASGPVGIPLKIPRLRRQAINLTPPKRVKAWGNGPLEARGMSSDETHSTRTVQHTTHPTEVSAIKWKVTPRINVREARI